MKLVYKITGRLLLLAFFVSAAQIAVAAAEYTKTIKKEFDISSDGTTSITNKYGKVEIKTWDRNRVKIDVTIVVKASSESKAQEVFDRIGVDFSNSSDYVKAETNIESKSRSWWNSSDKSDYRINYEVFLPAGNSLELNHRYGDAFVAELGGRADVSVKYGNLKAEGFGRSAKIYLGYSGGAIERVANLDAEVSYGKLSCGEAQNVSLNTKYSKITIDKANEVRCETKYDGYQFGEIRTFNNTGKYDNIRIGSVEKVMIASSYTQLSLEELTKNLELEMQYGGASIERLARGFDEVNITGKYTGFKIGVAGGADFQLDAYAKYAGIGYPSDMTITYEKDKGSEHEVKGYAGGENAKGNITARLNYGGLKVRRN